MKSSSPVNTAMQSQMVIMEPFPARHTGQRLRGTGTCLDAGERNGAVGALLSCSQSFEHLRTFYDAILVMHRNAELI